MWLIDVTNIQSLHLVEFLGDPPSSYAILSHTWGANEVTFQRFNALSAASSQSYRRNHEDADDDIYLSAGFAKIRNAAAVAKRQGFTYLWVDTCCINKASSAELSESINSMYLWYRKATICYAYLSDVDPNGSRTTSGGHGSDVRNSRWFTRGWTLQELIAPRVVEFYASDWSHMDTKQAGNETFCQILSEITGIWTDILAGTMLLSDVSVADKMRWASSRNTKRVEDTAYCLLGLFDVNMPLLYGEGSKAFIRLQEEILKETGDQSLFLWSLDDINPPSPLLSGDQALHGLLAQSPDAFSGLGIHHVRPLQPLDSELSEPASMTSRGLKTNMLLSPVNTSDYYAVLDCAVFRSQPLLREGVRIFLKRLWGNQFARINGAVSSGIEFFQWETSETKGIESTSLVYVKQKPTYAIPELTIKTSFFEGLQGIDNSSSFSVMEAFPPENFNMATSLVQIRDPQPGRTIVTLRFGRRCQQDWCPFVDISLGLQSQTSWWKLCCKMHPYNGITLENVYGKNQEITLHSEATSHIDDRSFGNILAHETSTQYRGRTFLQLEVFLRNLNDAILSSRGLQPTNDALAHQRDILRQVQDVTRQCCYQDRIQYVFSSDESLSLDAVRTEIEGAGHISETFGAIVLDTPAPFANILKRVRHSHFNSVKGLIAKNESLIELKTSDFDDFRLVHWAATKVSVEMMKTLADCKADLTSRTRSGWMAIHIAILAHAYSVADYLLENQRLSQGCANLAANMGETLSHWFAAYVGFAPHPPTSSTSHTIYSIEKKLSPGDLHVVNDRGELPVHRAAANGKPVAVPAFKMQSPDQVNAIDLSGRSVLFHAACGGNEENIEILFRMGASLEMADQYGRSPLHAAVMANRPLAVKLLLSLGANPNAVVNVYGLTPLHFACMYGFTHCAMSLVEGGGQLTTWTDGGLHFQPIHLAVANGHIECTKELFKAGLDVSSRCHNYLRLKRPQIGPLEETEVVGLPSPMAPLELAVFISDSAMASIISANLT